MLRRFLNRFLTRPGAGAEAAYAAIVAQARQPAFYLRMGVPDDPAGRFRMIALHVILLMEALLDDAAGVRGPREAREALARALQERMFDELDASLREMGVSDLAVPKRMRRLADAFYAQHAALRQALAAAPPLPALRQALARHIYAETEDASGAGMLAGYVQEAWRGLAGLALQDVAAGHVPWPAPDAAREDQS